MLGTLLTLAGLILMSVAAGLLTPGDLLGALHRQSTTAPAQQPSNVDAPPAQAPAQAAPTKTPPAQVVPEPTPNDPSSPSAAIAAIQSELASALSDGQVSAGAADDLTGDINTLQDRLNSGRRADVQRSAAQVQRTLDSQVVDGSLDVGVGQELSRLLDIFVSLSAGTR
jgi:hypothetical protein